MEPARVLRAVFVEDANAKTLPPELAARGVVRLRWMMIAVSVALLATIPLRLMTWGKPAWLSLSDIVAVTYAGLSALAVVAIRVGRFPDRVVLQLGLLYEVGLCFALAMVEQVLIGFTPLSFRFSVVTLVLLTFPLVVPSPPRWRLIATLVAACSQPFAIALVQVARDAFDPTEIVATSTPTLLVAGLAIYLGRVVHRLRVDASRARTYGQYELVRRLGEGGMGEVWEARHTHLLRPAALKLIRPETSGAYGEAARGRFEREAKATSALTSPHTVELFDFGATDDEVLYYAMELLEGIDLESLVQRFGPMDPARVLHVIGQTALSLAEAHEVGLVHRDIKPANVFLCRMGTELDFVKVLDFGLVKARYVGEGGPVSVAGAISGTPGYIAPEHLAGKELDGRADLYSLGCVAYFLLTGQRVFHRKSKMELLSAHLTEDPVPPSERSGLAIPGAIDALIMALLERDPDARPASARTLLVAAREIGRQLDARWDDAAAAYWWRANLPDALKPRSALVL